MSRGLVQLILCAPVLALLLTTSPSVAAGGDDDLYRAAHLYWDGDSTGAIEIWRRLAEDGSAIAACNIGIVYQRGEGVPADPAEAMRWYRVAAERDDAEAQYRLGFMYLRSAPTSRRPTAGSRCAACIMPTMTTRHRWSNGVAKPLS